MPFSRHLARDERGIAAVEFAMIAPVMLLMVCGFMEYAHVASARTTLESATMRAARAVAASDCPATRNALMMQVVTGIMDQVPSANNGQVIVETKSYGGNFKDVGEPEPFIDENGNEKYDLGEPYTDVNNSGSHENDMGKAGSIGAAGQVVSYTARYQVKSLFGFISNKFNGGRDYTIEASTVIRNEPVFRDVGCT